jgi:uroporphyrin-III C-methyltransferase
VSGFVHLVGAGPGDPGLLTVAGRDALRDAQVVVHDRLGTAALLPLCPPDAALIDAGKAPGRAALTQEEINAVLVEHGRAGRRVVRLKGGDPFVFGRGGEEALALAAAGIPFRIVPGITAGLAAPAAAGIPATHRTLAQSVAFVTGHNAGGGAPRAVDWAALARGAQTIVVYMGLLRLPEIARALLAAGRAPDEPVALLTEATTPRARREVTTLAAAALPAGRRMAGATLIVIGKVVELGAILAPWQSGDPAVADLPEVSAAQL